MVFSRKVELPALNASPAGGEERLKPEWNTIQFRLC